MVEKKVSLMDFEDNPNIGIYMFANDKFCLIGQDVTDKKAKEISKILNVPVYKTTILGTELLGIFIAGNNDCIFIPELPNYEFEQLKKICTQHNTKVITLSNRLNTFGNNICVGNKLVLLSEDYDNYTIDKIKKESKYSVKKISSKTFKAIGATFKFLNNKFFISQEYDEKEIEHIINNIGGAGTVNKGSYYISSGIIGNKYAIIIGTSSTSVEIQNIIESLDYI